jgi:four helix bundle protein
MVTTAAEELKERTRVFALDVIRLVRLFPRTLDAQIVGRQLIRAGTAVAANYRASCRSQSSADFISKISVVAEEADESQLWLDLTIAVPIVDADASRRLFREATELSKIFTASRNTAKANRSRR